MEFWYGMAGEITRRTGMAHGAFHMQSPIWDTKELEAMSKVVVDVDTGQIHIRLAGVWTRNNGHSDMM